MPEQDAMPEQELIHDQNSMRQEYCLAMLRWGIQALRAVKCENIEEYQYRLNVVGYLGNCYTAEGGTLAELQELDTGLQTLDTGLQTLDTGLRELDTEQWFTTEPNAGFPL